MRFTSGRPYRVEGANGLTPLISAPGLYDLEVTDILNGCTSADAVLITLDGNPPTPCIEPLIQIPCGDPGFLVGDTCAASTPYVYEWFVTGGNFLGDSTLPMVEIEWIDSMVVLNGLISGIPPTCARWQ